MTMTRKKVALHLSVLAAGLLFLVAAPGLAQAQSIRVDKIDSRTITNLSFSVEMTIGGHPLVDWEAVGDWNTAKLLDFKDAPGQWSNGVIVGNFLQLESNQPGGCSDVCWVNIKRTISGSVATSVRVYAEFYINGQRHWDYEDVGTLDHDVVLKLNAVGGTWNGNTWVGNFLTH